MCAQLLVMGKQGHLSVLASLITMSKGEEKGVYVFLQPTCVCALLSYTRTVLKEPLYTTLHQIALIIYIA